MTGMTRPQAMETARRMHAGEWTIPEIRRYLASRGVNVTWEQVKRWVDAEYEAARRAREARRKREEYRRKHNTQPHNYRNHGDIIGVLLDLRLEDGLTYPALIAVARRFYGLEFTDYSIRAELLKRGVKKNANKARAVRAYHQTKVAA